MRGHNNPSNIRQTDGGYRALCVCVCVYSVCMWECCVLCVAYCVLCVVFSACVFVCVFVCVCVLYCVCIRYMPIFSRRVRSHLRNSQNKCVSLTLGYSPTSFDWVFHRSNPNVVNTVYLGTKQSIKHKTNRRGISGITCVCVCVYSVCMWECCVLCVAYCVLCVVCSACVCVLCVTFLCVCVCCVLCVCVCVVCSHT